jgi:hypothetical protein
MRVAQKGCEECGQLSPFHRPTCKQLPPREDLVRIMREMLEAKTKELEACREVVEAAKALDQTYVDWKKLGLSGLRMQEALTSLALAEEGLPLEINGAAFASVDKQACQPGAPTSHGVHDFGSDCVCSRCGYAF